MVVLTFFAVLVGLGVHLWLARWVLSLSAPILTFVAYLLFATYVLANNPAKALMGAAIALVIGLPYVVFGAVTGALVARSLREEYVDVPANNPFQPIARDDARSG